MAEHGYHRFICPSLLSHPHAAQMPGAPGLIFRPVLANWTMDPDEMPEILVLDLPSYPVFTRIDQGAWLYQGLYAIKKGKPLSGEEWLQLSPQVSIIHSYAAYTTQKHHLIFYYCTQAYIL